MSKQVKASKPVKGLSEEKARLMIRSPKINLIWAGALGLLYYVLLNQNLAGALIYAFGAFLFFCTVDYCILYYRLNKENK